MYTLQGKTRPTRHVCFPRMLPAVGPHTWQPFASHQQRWTDPTAPKKKGSRYNPQPGWVIRKSVTQFLSQHSHWSSIESQTSVDNRLLGLPGPYHRHAVGMFNTCSRGLPHRKFWNSHSTLPALPFRGFHWSPNGPVRSQIVETTFTNWTGEGTNAKSHEWEPPIDFYRNLSSKHSMR
jgi:hypothetical protein